MANPFGVKKRIVAKIRHENKSNSTPFWKTLPAKAKVLFQNHLCSLEQ